MSSGLRWSEDDLKRFQERKSAIIEKPVFEPRQGAAIRFKLSWPPSTNTLYATVPVTKDGVTKDRRVPSGRAKKYKRAVERELIQQFGYTIPHVEGKCTLSLLLWPPDKRKRDASNHIKALEDALTEAKVWGDDSMVARVSSGFSCDEFGEYITRPGGEVEVTIVPLTFSQPPQDLFDAAEEQQEEDAPF